MSVREECEKLKNNILSIKSETPIKTIMVSSPIHGEGASTVALNFAETLAVDKALKVLLVDGNFRAPSIHKSFDMEKDHGLSDLIIGEAEVGDVIKGTDTPNLFVVTSGTNEVNPAKVFESRKFKDLIEKLTEKFDYAVFDSAPVNASPDASILASHMDGVILVVRAAKTRWEVAQKAKWQLEMTHSNILGVVLNRKKYIIPNFLYNRS